jgi:hypothetical protein
MCPHNISLTGFNGCIGKLYFIDTMGHVCTKISKISTHAENSMVDVIGGPNIFGEGKVLDEMKTFLHRLLFRLRNAFPSRPNMSSCELGGT